MNAPAELPIRDRLFHLRRRLKPRSAVRSALLDVPSLVNVALLLLMFFVAQSHFVLQPGIAVSLPAAPMTGGARYGSLVVTLTQEGLILFNDERTTFDGLADDLKRQARAQPDSALVIEADSRVRHGDLVRVYNLATAAGIRQVVLATRIPSPAGGP